jgi:hypothetical protein
MKRGLFGSPPVSLVTAHSMPGGRPTDLILATDGTEVSLARESEKKKCFLSYGRKKEPKFGTEVEVIIKCHATKKIFNE